MPTKRFWSSAVNTKSPEYLVVAGGRGADDEDLDTVEILVGEQWVTVQPLPQKCWRMESVIHGGYLYFLGGEGQGRDVYNCEVKSILSNPIIRCNEFALTTMLIYPASFGQQFIAIEFGSILLAYSFITERWVSVGRTPCKELGVSPVVLPTGELVVVEHNPNEAQSKVFKALLKGKVSM